VQVNPPAALLMSCTLPTIGAGVDFAINATTGDLVDAYLNWKDAAKQCAAKIKRLNQWYKTGSSQDGQAANKAK